jgi:hypothetical protein
MNFMWLHDVPDSKLKEFETYYGFSSKEFIEFLATLGLRTYSGKDKLAFNELKRQAYLRNWDVENPDQPSSIRERISKDKSDSKQQPALLASADPGAVKIGFTKQRDLFQGAAGSFVSLDYASPHPDAISMRWNYRYGDDWMWCLRVVSSRILKNTTKVSCWLKSDQKGPIFLRIDESDGESFFVITNPGLDWKQFEFSLTEFSVDDKTRQDGRLESEKISNLIIADPAAAHNKIKGIRTLWVSDLIFK